jgi:hypothetical protein
VHLTELLLPVLPHHDLARPYVCGVVSRVLVEGTVYMSTAWMTRLNRGLLL